MFDMFGGGGNRANRRDNKGPTLPFKLLVEL